MGVKNWLGQEIEVGDIVYKARRDGNSTTQMLGRVRSIDEDKLGASIEWLAFPAPRRIWVKNHWEPKPEQEFYAEFPKRSRVGTNDIDSLVKIEHCALVDALDIPF